MASAVRRRDIGAIEVVRTDRRDRRLRGKSDTIDAENAARAVLAGQATAVPKTADGTVEMIWRSKRLGPVPLHLGRHVRYRLSDVDDWLAEMARDGKHWMDS